MTGNNDWLKVKEITIVLKMGQWATFGPKSIALNFSLILFIRCLQLDLITGIKNWVKVTVWIFKEN